MADKSAGVLREFLVKLGFKINQQEFKKFRYQLEQTTKLFAEFGKTVSGAASILSTEVTVMANKLEKLYFASQRTHTSANNLKAFGNAAEQIGVSSEEAMSAVENLTRSLRLNPGLRGLLQTLKVNPDEKDGVKQLLDLVDALSKMPFYQGSRVAALFGMDDNTLFMLEKNRTELQKYYEQQQKLSQNAGFSKASQDAHRFMQELRGLEQRFEALSTLVAERFIPVGEKVIGWLTQAIDLLIRADKTTEGWSTRIVGVVSALTTLKGVSWLLSLFGKVFGRGAAGAAGAEAGAAAKTAGAGGLLGSIAAGAGIGIALNRLIDSYTQKLNANTAYRNQVELYHQDLIRRYGPTGMPPGAVPLHNPGNLRFWGNTPLAVRGKNGTFASFTSDFEGLSAMAGQLIRYAQRGITNIKDIINKYAPAGDHNDVVSYINDVSKRLGVKPMQSLNLADPQLLEKLEAAMIHHEQGFDPFNMKLIDQAVRTRLAQPGFGLGKVEVNQKTEIAVNGAGDPRAVGRAVAGEQSRVNGDMLRNFQGAVQ